MPPPALRRKPLCVHVPPQLSGRKRSVRLRLRFTLATWAGQVEAEFAQVHARLDETFAEIYVTTSFSREVVTACADQVAYFDIILRQFVNNNFGRVVSLDDGGAQDRQR